MTPKLFKKATAILKASKNARDEKNNIKKEALLHKKFQKGNALTSTNTKILNTKKVEPVSKKPATKKAPVKTPVSSSKKPTVASPKSAVKKPTAPAAKKAPAKKPTSNTNKKPVKASASPVAVKNIVDIEITESDINLEPTAKSQRKRNHKTSILENKEKGNNINSFQLNDIIRHIIDVDAIKQRNRKLKTIRTSAIVVKFEKYRLANDIPEKIIKAIQEAKIDLIHDIEGVKTTEDFIEHLKINNTTGAVISKTERVNDVLQQIFSGAITNSIILTKEDELKYVKYAHSKDPEIARLGRHKLITSNLRLVTTWARKYSKRGIEFEDLIQEGTIGLNKAIDKFDYKQNNKFATYATWWIRQAITRIITDQNKIIRIPVHMSEFINNFNKKEQELTNDYGRLPSIDELTEELPGSARDVSRKISELKKIISNPVSLEKPISSDEESHFTDFVKDDATIPVDEMLENDVKYKELHKVMANKLTPDEERIICMRSGMKEYGESLSLEDIAKELKITKEKVRQIETKAMKKIKQGLNSSISLFTPSDK